MSAEQAEKLNQAADVLRNQGQTGEAKRNYEEAGHLFTEAGDKIKAADCQLLIATCLYMEGNIEKSILLASEAATKFAELGARDLEGSAYVNVGSAYLNADQLDKAEEWFKKALGILENVDPNVGHGYYLGIAHTKLGSAYVKQGRIDNAAHEFDEALEILRHVGHWFFEQTTLMHMASMYFEQKSYNDALTYAQASLALLFQENTIDEHKRRVAELKGAIAWCYWSFGNEAWGVRFFQEATDLLNDMPDDVVQVVTRKIRADEFLAQLAEKRPQDRIKINLKALTS